MGRVGGLVENESLLTGFFMVNFGIIYFTEESLDSKGDGLFTAELM